MRMQKLRIKNASNCGFTNASMIQCSLAEKNIWISIGNVGQEYYPKFDEDWPYTKARLNLSFADVGSKTANGAITPEQAKQIVDFVRDNADEDTLVMINCMAGVSRSAGVAAALTKLALKTDQRFFKRYTPNMLVYRAVLDAGMEILG
jgi:predicted protein tyrosine phosphatase